jgi:sirohydrochlorin ferrochelatase
MHNNAYPSSISCLQLVAKFKHSSGHELVEAAHMELAEPSIATAYQRCVDQGASNIVCHPYFLSRGRHVQEDIPALMLEAAAPHPHTQYTITEPLGLQEDQIVDLIKNSIDTCMGKA